MSLLAMFFNRVNFCLLMLSCTWLINLTWSMKMIEWYYDS